MAGARHKFNELEVEMIDINELRRLAQAATPGPWINHGRHGGWHLTRQVGDYAVTSADPVVPVLRNKR
jgi:hypothetical protein